LIGILAASAKCAS